MLNGAAVPLSADCITVAADGDILAVATTDLQWHVVQAGAVNASVAGVWPLGMALSNGTVYAAAGAGGLVSAPMDLTSGPEKLGDLKDPRAVLAVGDGNLLVADSIDGVALIDGSGAELGRVAPPIPWAPATSLAWVTPGTRAVAGFGGFGIGIVDVGSGLTMTGELHTKALSLSVASDGGNLVVSADWNTARLIDITDPANPVQIAREFFGKSRAVSVAWAGGAFHVAGLDHLTALTPNPAVIVPELRLDRRKIKVQVTELGDTAIGSAGLLIYNDGRADLELTGFSISDPEGQTEATVADPLVIGAGVPEFIEVTVKGLAKRTVQLSFQTNDPDNADVSIVLDVQPDALQVGDAAPDFTVPMLSGHMFRMSDFTPNHVVHLKPFNSLCSTCADELPHIESELNQKCSPDFLPLSVHSGPDVAYAFKTANDKGITFPMVFDFDSTVLDLYSRIGTGVPLFPLAYLVHQGTVTDIYTDVEPTIESLKETITELGGCPVE